MKLFLSSLISLVAVCCFYPCHSQCPINITAEAQPPIACGPSGTVTLIGNASGGNILDFGWSPSTGLADPLSPVTTAQVNFPITYTFTARALTNNNLAINGDFEGGNAGISSSLAYVSPGPGLLNGGTYTIATSPAIIAGNFPDCADHTTGSGNMMIVNASGSPNRLVWCQTYNIPPTSDLLFSMWIGTALSIIPAELIVSVNGQQIGGVVTTSSTPCIWANFEAEWNNPGASTVVVCITNINGAAIGPYFTLDDIVVREICQDTAQVNVGIVNLVAQATPPPFINCNNPVVQLDGSLSSAGPNIRYEWLTTDGNIVSGANTLTPRVDRAGTYTLVVIFEDGNGSVCEKTTEVKVLEDPGVPDAQAMVNDTLSCQQTSIEIDGNASSRGGPFRYTWTSPNGNILSGGNTLQPTVNSAGDYTLIVENTDQNCADSITVQVIGDTLTPIAKALPQAMLNCRDSIIRLYGEPADTGIAANYTWTTLNGHILQDTNSLAPLVDAVGTYYFIITNTENACSDTAEVVVVENLQLPDFPTPLSDTLNCRTDTVSLRGTVQPADSIFTWQWTALAGRFFTDADSLNIATDTAAVFTFRITDTTNHCSSIDTVIVRTDFEAPVFNAGLNQTYFCNTDSLLIFPQIQNQSPGFEYRWFTYDGTIVNNAQSEVLSIGGPGIYYLEVTNSENGCLAIDSVLITPDTDLPLAVILIPDTLTCDQPVIDIDGRNSESGNDIAVNWTTSNGNIISNQSDYEISVDEPGIYHIEVVNTNTGCRNTAAVEVVENKVAPDIAISGRDTLSCRLDTLVLEVSDTNLLNTLTYNWTALSGSISGGRDQNRITVARGGQYVAEVVNTQNGCIGRDTVIIAEDRQAPAFAINTTNDTLNCIQRQANLNISFSGIPPVASDFEWRASVPGFNPTQDSAILVMEGGWYFAEVEDSANGCSTLDSVFIFVDTIAPVGNLYFPKGQILNCLNPSLPVILNNINSGVIDIQLVTANGSSNSDSVTVTLPGAVELLLTDTNNGCTSSELASITADFEVPLAEAGDGADFTCSTDSLQLDATVSDAGNQYIHNWGTLNGRFGSQTNTLTPFVLSPGRYELTVTNIRNGCQSTDSVLVVAASDLPEAIAGLPDTLTCDISEVQIDASQSSSGSNLTYTWTTPDGNITSGQQSLSPLVDAPGQYVLVIRDTVDNCETSTAVEVVENRNTPQFSISSPGILSCGDTVLTLEARPGDSALIATYDWFTNTGNILSGITTPRPTVNEPGIYRLTIRDEQNGCQAIDSVVVTADRTRPDFVINTPQVLTCRDSNIQLLVVLNGNQSVVYEWSTTSGNFISSTNIFNPVVNAVGLYQVEVTNLGNKCVARDTVSVFEDRMPPDIQLQKSNDLTCRDSIIAVSIVNANPQYSYQWLTTDGQIISTPTAYTVDINRAGTYILEVFDNDNGCSGKDSVSVAADLNVPVIDIPLTDTLTCAKSSIDILPNIAGGDSFSVAWQSFNGVFDTLDGLDGIRIFAGGDYRLEVRNTVNGCTEDATIQIAVDSIPPVISILPPDTLDCATTEVIIDAGNSSAGPQYAYRWTTRRGNIKLGGNTLRPVVDNGGIYKLIITNIFNGCTAADSITVFKNENILTGAALRVQQPNCRDTLGDIHVESVFGGTRPLLYSLDGGQSFSTQVDFPDLQPGAYYLVIEDAAGCRYEENISLIPPVTNMVFLPNIIETTLGNSVQLSFTTNIPDSLIGNITWTPADGLSCTDCPNPVFLADGDQVFSVEVVDVFGCEATASVEIRVDETPRVYIPSAFSPNDDGINDYFYIYAANGMVLRVRKLLIFDRWGNLVYEGVDIPANEEAFGWNGRYKGVLMNSGVFAYYAELEFINGQVEIYKGDLTLKR